MSAAQWRKAMNSGAGRRHWNLAAATGSARALELTPGTRQRADGLELTWQDKLWQMIGWRHVFMILACLLYPVVATPFFTFQIGAQTLALGIIALSLTFLGGYGGMVTLSQMTIAGIAGYVLAIFGNSAVTVSLGWPWWLAVLMALTIATLIAAGIGWMSVRTEGIYTIMITLAIGVAFYYLAQQNYTLFNGFQGFSKITPPDVFGIDWRAPTAYYYLVLFWALAAYFFIKYLIRAPFGIALQGVRENPRRMNALGFSVNAHRVAAHAVAGFIAALGGILMVWYTSLITPGSIGTGALINVLIVVVLGGMKHPIGAFVGALVFVLLQNFAVDIVGRERFNLLIGGVFLLVVLFSPDGLVGLWMRLRNRFTMNAQDKLSSFK
jgi:branched-chain amino acid transport system permease protein